MLAFRQFGVGCHVNIAVKLVRGFHFHRGTRLIDVYEAAELDLYLHLLPAVLARTLCS